MKKLFFPLSTLVCISAAISCKKELATDDKVLKVASNSTSNNTTITDGPHFGALVDEDKTDDRITVASKLGVSYVRAAIILKDYKGRDAGVEKYTSSGFKILLNLNYDNGKAVPFPKDMVAYRKLLEAVLSKYKPEVAVIENEPTTDIFHSGPIEDYITELKNAIDVCHQYGVKVADGAIHAAYVKQVMNGSRLSGNALEVKKLIDAFKTLNLDYVNVHTDGSGVSYPDGLLEKVADYLRATTGKEVMSNEFNVKSTSTSLITSMVNAYKAGKYKYVIVRSGYSNSGAVPLHQGTNLLPNGIAYRDATEY